MAATLVLGASGADAQLADLLSQVRSGSAPGDVLDAETEERALSTATRSFGRTATRRIEEIRRAHPELSEERLARMREMAAAQTERFAGLAREELIAAKGDGLLTQEELAEEIAEVRDERLEVLEEGLDALLSGAPPPPRRAEASGTLAHLRAAARYTLLERNPPDRWGLLTASVLGALLLARAGVFALRRMLGEGGVARRIRRFTALARGPFYLGAAAGGAFAGLRWLWLPVGIEEWIAPVTLLLLAIAALWLAWNVSGPLGHSIARLSPGATEGAISELDDLVRKALRLAALLLFTLVAIEGVLGADITTVVAALGIVGVAASVAAQDTLRNVVGSMTLHGDRPFVVGDLIRFQGHFGTIQEIGFRSTRMRTLEGPIVVVPNAELVRENVENVSMRPWVRHVYAIDLVYGTPSERLEEALDIVREILEKEDHPSSQPPHVAFEEFGAHSLRLRLWWCSDTSDYWQAMRQRTRVNLAILGRFREAGLEFAFPTRTLHVETPPESAPAPEEAGETNGDEPD